ncbi:beta/gamma crystallin domain-containing protein [Pseudoduganella chitinolytica]|uniref:Beta/gamma crystallin domain-containing protein n=1 Tax=Pseudoduganella chitinolytica TaxID=34070 RepID=A0ABY8BIR8_9BURK|nr:beta/gamma crystallin domain-containing protein [Pseudoduganella chitinolytica]WEF35268.1 beta/gamma crystallin domain-containing protein [Pseudoduganella chitinolytica]
MGFSMSLMETTLASPGHDQVIFYEGRDFGGKAYLTTLGAEVDIYKSYRSLNDKLHSVKVGAACKVIAFKHSSFGSPTKEMGADCGSIDIGGMSGFIVLNKEKHHALLFTFTDSTGEGRSMTLQSAGFGAVIQPNPEPEDGIDPNVARAFVTLKETDVETMPVVTAIFVRKSSGEYESPNGSLQFYWQDGNPHARNIPEYDSARLSYKQTGNLFHFTWE